MSGTAAQLPASPAVRRATRPSQLPPLRLAFVSGTLGNGGAERQLAYMVERLRPRVEALLVLSLTEGEIWERRLRAAGVDVEPFGRSRSKLLRLAALTHRLRRFRPHIVHCQHSFANPYAVVAGRLAGARTVASPRGDLDRALDDTVRSIATAALRRADRVVANSAAAIDQLRRLGVAPSRLLLLPNVVDSERFRPAEPAAAGDRGGDPVRLGLVGRLERVKRPDLFLEAIDKLGGRGVAVRGVVAGDGRLAARLDEEVAGRSSIEVEILGEVDDVAELYRRLDILVLTSEHEGSPNAILEAMATGLPVVAFGVGAVPDLLGGRDAAIAPPGDLEGLVDRLEHLVRSPDDRRALGRANRRRAVAQHAPERVDTALIELYRPLLAPSRPADAEELAG